MGGFGSGRRFGKDCTDDMQALDVRRLKRLLTPGNVLSVSWPRGDGASNSIHLRVDVDRVTLEYQARKRGGEWRPVSTDVWLDWTRCPSGGQRAWWLCPGEGCGRRVAVLYGGEPYACRHCHNLSYRSQHETDFDLALRRADTIRQRLGWRPGIAHGYGTRPKYMHWRTYWRLRDEYDARVNEVLPHFGVHHG